MQRWSIKHQVLLLALVPTITISLLLGAYFTSTRIQDLEQTFRERGEAIALKLAPTAEYGVFSKNKPLLQNLAQATLHAHAQVQSVAFYSADGNEIAHAGATIGTFTAPLSAPPSADLNTRLFVEENLNSLAFMVPIISYKEVHDVYAELTATETLTGWVKIELETSSNRIREYQVLIHTGMIFLLGLCLSGLHAFQMGRNVTRPILELAESVERIKHGDFHTRTPVSTYKELQVLESGINTMSEVLQNAHSELKQKVEKATGILRRTLETIEVQNIELNEARQAAEAASQVKSAFLADMSHEIRTPLNGVIGFINLLQKTELAPKQKDYLNIIQKSAHNLLLIINDILDFSKIEAGKLSMERIKLNVRDCIEETLTLLAPHAQEKGLALIPLIYSDVPAQLLGDPLRLKQIITNLVGNAIKFTETGSVIVRVMLEQETPSQATIRISVTDTGIGLTPTDQQNLFQAFNQANIDTTRKFGGTGLGLAICKKLVEQMDGNIGLESEPGQGSTFWFTFKAYKDFEAPLPLPPVPIPSSSSPAAFVKEGPLFVLAVDDNPENLKLITAMLEELNINVVAFNNAPQAIELLQTQEFHLILMDIRMPNMNGIQATHAIRQLETTHNRKSTPIIALTAHALVSEREALLNAGIDDCLIKPISEHELKSVIAKWTNHQAPLKTVDWTLAKQLAGGKQDLATELFEKLVKSLPDEKRYINQAFTEKEWELMRDLVHRLHGALCYCGVPELKRCAHNLESALATRTMVIIEPRLEALNHAIDQVLTETA